MKSQCSSLVCNIYNLCGQNWTLIYVYLKNEVNDFDYASDPKVMKEILSYESKNYEKFQKFNAIYILYYVFLTIQFSVKSADDYTCICILLEMQ